MVLQDATLPSSRTAGFLNEVAFLAPSPCHSTHWLLCDKQYKLGLGHTSKATHGCDLVARAIPPPFTHLQQPCRRPAEPYSGASYYHTGSGDQFPGPCAENKRMLFGRKCLFFPGIQEPVGKGAASMSVTARRCCGDLCRQWSSLTCAPRGITFLNVP